MFTIAAGTLGPGGLDLLQRRIWGLSGSDIAVIGGRRRGDDISVHETSAIPFRKRAGPIAFSTSMEPEWHAFVEPATHNLVEIGRSNAAPHPTSELNNQRER